VSGGSVPGGNVSAGVVSGSRVKVGSVSAGVVPGGRLLGGNGHFGSEEPRIRFSALRVADLPTTPPTDLDAHIHPRD
jgi:hypothetical protein